MKRLSIFLLFILTGNIVFSQSLFQQNQEKVDLLLQSSEDMAKEDLTKADSLASEGMELSKRIGDSLSYYRIMANKGVIYNRLRKKEKALEFTQKSLIFFREKG